MKTISTENRLKTKNIFTILKTIKQYTCECTSSRSISLPNRHILKEKENIPTSNFNNRGWKWWNLIFLEIF